MNGDTISTLAASALRGLAIAGLLVGAFPLPANSAAAGAECRAMDPEHGGWTRLLAAHVREGMVDYTAIQSTGRPALNAYLAELEGVCREDYERWSKEEKLAYWINAYNAYTVKLIVDNYPIDSIRRIGFLPGAAFRTQFIPARRLRGGFISLQTIEDEILRGELAETRIHFAIVCASKGCPILASTAYTGDRLNQQLDEAARRFLGDPFRTRWDPETRTLKLSMIFSWFRADFEKAAGSLAAFVRPSAPDEIAAALAKGDVDIDFLPYDWSLNGK